MGLINEYANFLKNIPQSLSGFYHQVGDSLYGSPNNISEEQKEATTLRLRLSIQDARNAHNKWLASLDRINQTGSRPVGDKINRDFDTYITNLKKLPEENTKINVSGSGSSSSNSWDSRYNDVLNNLTQEQQYYLDSKGINFQTARGLQEGLNKNFNSGLVVDNKWGSKSQTALDKILAEMPQMSKEDNEKYRPSTTGVINQNDLLQEQISPFARISNPILLNRSDTRSILRNYGYNPYSFTGSQRKALRKYLNGDYNQKINFIDRNSDLFKELIAPFVTFLKKGGLLVSNNPVERFKVKKGLNGFQITYKPLVAANSFFDDSKKKLKSEIESKISEAQARNDRLESSHRKANKNNLAPRKANNTAYLLDLLYKIGAFGNIKYEKAVDGIKGRLTSNAIKKAKEMGYTIDEQSGKISKGSSINITSNNGNISKSQEVANKLVQGLREVELDRLKRLESYRTPITQYDAFSLLGSRLANSNPAVALVNRKLHGLLGLNANYSEIPIDLVDILSDQNQYIYDNWNDALSYNLNVARNNLIRNLLLFLNTIDEQEKMNLQLEIENNKESIANIQSKISSISQAGGLENWLKSNPGQKMVIGANFRFYKDRNRNRFGKNTPSGYANFEAPNYVAYSMSTPLGKVENIYGNTVQSFMYDPSTNLIVTKMSDAYDFNKKGSESNSRIAKLREKAGTDKQLSNKGSVKYSVQLKPIQLNGKTKNYTTNFGDVNREDSQIEKFLIDTGLNHYENK